mgnify:CR=1 FL=1
MDDRNPFEQAASAFKRGLRMQTFGGWVQIFVGVLVLLAGIASWVVAILILVVALLLAIANFEWDGPILWGA